MQLNTALQHSVGTDLGTITRSQIAEIHSTAILEAIGRATGKNVSHIVADVPDICGLQLLRRIECDLGSLASVMIRIAIVYDWQNFRIMIAKDGERVALITTPQQTTYPAIQAQAAALENFVSKVCRAVDTSKVGWTYIPDFHALELRGRDFIYERLGLQPANLDTCERYNSFKPGRQITQALDEDPSQTLRIALSKEVS